MKSFDELLEASISPNVVHKRGLSNHLPMALLALQELGATTEHSNQFFEKYTSSQLTDYQFGDGQQINLENWQEKLGQTEFFDDYFAFFSDFCQKNEASIVLRTFLPRLSQSPVAAAFHSIIRLGYAIEYKIWEDLAYSLSLWAATYLELPKVEKNESQFDYKKLDFDFLQQFKIRHTLSGKNITRRAAESVETETFKEVFALLGQSDGFEVAKKISQQVMAETLDFTALHLITGTYATSIIHKSLNSQEDKDLCESALLPSLIAAYFSMVHSSTKNCELRDDVSVDEIKQIGSHSMNDHVIKLADVAVKEYLLTNNSIYLSLAEAYSREINN